MAITILGASQSGGEKAEHLLPRAEVDLPHPASAPENHLLLDRERITALLSHESPLVRTYALEQIARRTQEDWEDVLVGLVGDPDPMVAGEAIAILGRRKSNKAADAIVQRFEAANGEVAAVAASALGLIAPERLLEAVKRRGRLDDEAYAATATSLAVIPSPDVVEFLDKALNRAGALPPERRGTLYGAALLSGNKDLTARVLGVTIEDSQKEEPEGAAFPTRAALGGVAGVPVHMTARSAGLELFDQSREILEKVVAPLFPEEERKKLEGALKLKRPGEVLKALAPVLEMTTAKVEVTEEEKQDVVEELGTMPERRRGLLEALIARADTIGKLELNAAALFVAAAVKACVIIVAGGDEASSEAVQALAKAMENEVPAEKLARMSTNELAEMFRGKGARSMRRVLSVLTRESFKRSRTLVRFAKGAIMGGYAKDLLETMGEIKEVSIQNPILDAFAACPKEAEAAIVEVFSERTLNEKALPYALAIAEEIRTERVGLAIARRFYDLRDHGRAAVARTLMRVADPRVLPLLESRAYPDEAEEVAWAALSLVHGQPLEGKVKEAHDRSLGVNEDRVPVVRLPLRCKRCKEMLTYGFKRVYLDIEARDQWGDPAFVGEVKCKACGFDEDPFEPTEAATQILTGHMMEFLAATRAGLPVERPLVTPAQTSIHGRRMGFARALRELDKEVAASPSSVRTRLHRARMRLMLERGNAEEDLHAIIEQDPQSVEALTLRASVSMRRGDHSAAARDVIDVLKKLERPEELRLYDVDDTTAFKESLEELLVELRHLGAEIPEGIQLEAAERRISERAQALMEIEAQRRAAIEERQRRSIPPEERELDPEVLRKTGRNDPCPCGSGKKFKKCHGA